MMKEGIESTGDILAKIISAVFHPLLIPIYGMLIIFSAPTLFGFLPPKVKTILVFIVLINNVLVPLSLMPYFRLRNIITSWTVINRKERTIPLFSTTFFYMITVYLVIRYHIPFFIKSFLISAALLSLIISLVNLRMKISIHAAGLGALTALIVILSLKMHAPLTLMLIAAVMSSGLVLSSRLWLNSHNPPEVWFGYFLGILVPALILSIF
jgi:hypothetical protein